LKKIHHLCLDVTMWFKCFHVSVCVQIIALLSGCHLISPFLQYDETKKSSLFQYNFLPCTYISGKKKSNLHFIKWGGAKASLWATASLVQERNYLLKSFKHELHISFHKTDSQIVSLFYGRSVFSFVPCTYYRTYDSCLALLCPIFIYLFVLETEFR
jgi:hypothetical protein